MKLVHWFSSWRNRFCSKNLFQTGFCSQILLHADFVCETCLHVVFFSSNLYIGFPPFERDFVHGTWCGLIFLSGACCVLIFHENKNQHAIGFMSKTLHTTSSTNKISFTRRKISVKACEKNQHATSFTNKNQLATSSVSCREKSMNNFYEGKNQRATSFTTHASWREKSTCNEFYEYQISMQQFPWTKSVSKGEISTCNKIHKQKTTRNKFQEQNQFHEEKNQCKVSWRKNQHATSFTNKISMH